MPPLQRSGLQIASLAALIAALTLPAPRALARAGGATSTAAVSPAAAASPSPSQAKNSIGISVTPAEISPTIAAGDQTAESVIITNRSGVAVTVAVQPGAGGQPGGGVSIAVQPTRLNLRPGQSATVAIRITAGAQAPPGSVRGLVAIQARPSGGGEISVGSGVDVILDVNVIQPVVGAGFSAPLVVDGGEPAVFSLRGSNNNRFPARLDGSVSVGGLLSGTGLSGQSRELASGQSADLREVWSDPPTFGIGRVTMQLSAGAGSPVRSTALIIFFPWKLGLMLIGLAFTTTAGFFLGKGFR